MQRKSHERWNELNGIHHRTVERVVVEGTALESRGRKKTFTLEQKITVRRGDSELSLKVVNEALK